MSDDPHDPSNVGFERAEWLQREPAEPVPQPLWALACAVGVVLVAICALWLV